ncbi:hypothetical protein [Psychrobacter sp. UBA3962]|uniref:hypothetical protein n=1 Tax=Psychrobacter sp. UBA3962 TaxID=1947352 RepID=UPI0025FD42D6|nr:hypothetical protein [Psychrobacter sp. UBA3962]
MRFILIALFVSILGGCSAHVALLTLDKQADNQQQFIDNYDYEMSLMEAKDYE